MKRWRTFSAKNSKFFVVCIALFTSTFNMAFQDRWVAAMSKKSLLKIEALVDQLIAGWPESWFLPNNFLVAEHIHYIQSEMTNAEGLSTDELSAVQALINEMGIAQFQNQIPTLIHQAQIRYVLSAEAREIEGAKERERAQELKRQQERENQRVRNEAERAQREKIATERAVRQEQDRLRELQAEAMHQDALLLYESSYLEADSILERKYGQLDVGAELSQIKIDFLRNWFEEHRGDQSESEVKLDDEQLHAIGSVNGHIQLVARAGSGKTATVVFRAFFLLSHCGVGTNEMLLLAFNRSAAIEIRRRLLFLLHPDAKSLVGQKMRLQKNSPKQRKDITLLDIEEEAISQASVDLGVHLPFVMTFHALARSIVQPTGYILFDEEESGTLQLSDLVQKIVDEALEDPEKATKVQALLLSHFRQDWELITSEEYKMEPGEFLRWRRSLPRRSIDDRYLKSRGEKLIADFLFENSVDYKYEYNFPWGSRTYKPDFTLFKTNSTGVVIEYFGLAGESDYDAQMEEKKKYWSSRPDWELISLYPNDFARASSVGIDQVLGERLVKAGVKLVPLSEDEIWEKIKIKAILQYTKAVSGFILRCRQLGWDWKELQSRAKNFNFLTPGEEMFVRQATHHYRNYQTRLAAQGDTDFAELLLDASEKIDSGADVFLRRNANGSIKALRYLFVDEFQDFSFMFNKLVESIQRANPLVEIFCVGDDWQAINGFAGSDLTYFENFTVANIDALKLDLSTNYRSDGHVVGLGNTIMESRGIASIAKRRRIEKVLIGDLSKFVPTPGEQETHARDSFTPAVLRLIENQLELNRDVALLSRTNSLPYFINTKNNDTQGQSLEGFLVHVRSFFNEEIGKRISVSTAHKYKGRQRQCVIVLDASERRYPFIHPEWVFSRILGSDLDSIIDEERRLFYVAATRAIDQLIVLFGENEMTPFLRSLAHGQNSEPIEWQDFRGPSALTRQLLVQVGNAPQRGDGGTFPIKDQISASGYTFTPGSPWPHWRKAFVASKFSIELVKDEVWARPDKQGVVGGLEIRVYSEPEGVIACFQVQGGLWTTEFNNLHILMEEELAKDAISQNPQDDGAT